MNNLKVLFALTMMVLVADATFIVTGGGLALAALLGLKVAAFKGVAIGAALGAASRRSSGRRYYRRRWGRSIEEPQDDQIAETLLQASLNDAEDCAKKLVCSLNAQENLTETEAAIVALFGRNDAIDVSAVTAEFDLAALMGRKVGEAQCQTIYARCPYQTKDLMDMISNTNDVYYNNL